jgi:hypothetical protein
MDSFDAAETVVGAMQSATHAINLVKYTISLVTAVTMVEKDMPGVGTNIPALLAHNEFLMQSTVQALQHALVLAKQQAGAGAAVVAAVPEIQLLEETLALMRQSLAR